MRLARKLFLIAAAAIAMIAFTAPTANAVEVSAEGGAHCPEVEVDNDHDVTGGCLVEAETDTNPATLANHFHLTGEGVFSICDNVFSARIHESGDGVIFAQDLSGANCGIEPCDEAEGASEPHANYVWPANLMEFGPQSATNPAPEAIQVTFCVRGLGDPEGSSFGTCTVFVPMVTVAPHTYRFVTIAPGPSEPRSDNRLSSRCSQNAATSLTGQWQIHGTPLEVTH